MMKGAPHTLAWLLVGHGILACNPISDAGVGGAGGLGAMGGMGGAAGNGPTSACVPASDRCVNGALDPIMENASCQVAPPPALPDACDGTEPLERPTQCPTTGNAVSYQLTAVAIDEDCNSGYDLDGCDGDSCLRGGLAPDEGTSGVDNGLAALAGFVEDLGANLGVINQAYYDSLCSGFIDIRFSVDVNAEANCANVTPIINGETGGAVALNVSDDGCLSGDLGTLPIFFGGATRSLGNVRLRLTYSAEGFANGRLGATIDGDTAASIAAALIGVGANVLVPQTLDIHRELEVDPEAPCDALSIALTVGGVAIE